MCISLSASIQSSLVSLFTSILLYFNVFNQDQRKHQVFQVIALFLFFVSFMQWYDIVFWLNQRENATNYVFTKIAMITNHLQPIVFAALVSMYIPLHNITKVVILVYAICAVLYSYHVFHQIDYTLVTQRSHPVLEWQWTTRRGGLMFYVLFIIAFTCIALELPYPLNYIMVTINFGTLILSYYSSKRETFGKQWCVIAAYIPLLLVFVEPFVKV